MKIENLKGFNKLLYSISIRGALIKEIICLKYFSGPKLAEYRLKRILKYAYKHCKYYNAIIKEKNININKLNIQELPILSKEIIKQNFNNIVSDEYKKLIYKDSYTGGSTGEPLHFYNQMIFDGLYQNKLWRNMGYQRGDIILAMDGTKIEEEVLRNNIYWGIKSKNQLPYGGYFLSSLYLRNENIKYYIDYIFNLKPSFIRGYPFFIYTIAKYIQDNGLLVDFLIKGIELTSESSFPYQRDCIQEVFHTKVFMQYGHTECCAFAYTFDKQYQYMIEPLYGLIEVLDNNNLLVKKGEIGEIVVTTYHNKIFPMIRYRTGDFAEVDILKTGEMILTNIYGRTQDYILDKSGNKIMITALIMAQHSSAMAHIMKWQIEQFIMGEVIMHIIRGKDYSIKDEAELIELFDKNGGIKVSFEYTKELPVTKRGKSKLIIQNISDN